MYKIVIIGEKEDILPYQSLGVGIEPVKTIADTISILRVKTQDASIGIIFITENVAEQCLDTISEIRNRTNKPITIISTQQGSKYTGMMELNKEIVRAVGVDILTETK